MQQAPGSKHIFNVTEGEHTSHITPSTLHHCFCPVEKKLHNYTLTVKYDVDDDIVGTQLFPFFFEKKKPPKIATVKWVTLLLWTLKTDDDVKRDWISRKGIKKIRS